MAYGSGSPLPLTDSAERWLRNDVQYHKCHASCAVADVRGPALALCPAVLQPLILSVVGFVFHVHDAALAVFGVSAEPCAVELSVVSESR